MHSHGQKVKKFKLQSPVEMLVPLAFISLNSAFETSPWPIVFLGGWGGNGASNLGGGGRLNPVSVFLRWFGFGGGTGFTFKD